LFFLPHNETGEEAQESTPSNSLRELLQGSQALRRKTPLRAMLIAEQGRYMRDRDLQEGEAGDAGGQ